jgi:hypothetical protein
MAMDHIQGCFMEHMAGASEAGTSEAGTSEAKSDAVSTTSAAVVNPRFSLNRL